MGCLLRTIHFRVRQRALRSAIRGGCRRLAGACRSLVLRFFRRAKDAEPRHLGHLLQPALGQRIGFRVVVDVDVEAIHHVEARILEELLQRTAAQRRIDVFLHERGEIGFRCQGFDRRRRRLRRRLDRAGLATGWRLDALGRRLRVRLRGDGLQSRPATQESFVAAHRPVFSRRRPSLPTKDSGRRRCFGSGR